jgi:hypothetical protein
MDTEREAMLKDDEDSMIYKRILYIGKRVVKQGKKAQAAEKSRRKPSQASRQILWRAVSLLALRRAFRSRTCPL